MGFTPSRRRCPVPPRSHPPSYAPSPTLLPFSQLVVVVGAAVTWQLRMVGPRRGGDVAVGWGRRHARW